MPGISIGGCAGVSELERKLASCVLHVASCKLCAAISCALQAVRCCELKPQPLRAGPSRRQLRHPFSHAASALLTQIGCTYICVGLAYMSLPPVASARCPLCIAGMEETSTTLTLPRTAAATATGSLRAGSRRRAWDQGCNLQAAASRKSSGAWGWENSRRTATSATRPSHYWAPGARSRRLRCTAGPSRTHVASCCLLLP
jgi:hypothetical protein